MVSKRWICDGLQSGGAVSLSAQAQVGEGKVDWSGKCHNAKTGNCLTVLMGMLSKDCLSKVAMRDRHRLPLSPLPLLKEYNPVARYQVKP